ncbi:hypothetical protein EVAR_67068_1 [Eumeta japonica]|uniref:Uncharacterized protein n=1 Tax=Eumeta variegata TaxID=151549 RepID=A0A4C1ZKT6_EUMVA|nr:hypothetical protein EVAR_67068_1 [Eumeta japonica]
MSVVSAHASSMQGVSRFKRPCEPAESRWSPPPVETRNPERVISALSTSSIGTEYLMEGECIILMAVLERMLQRPQQEALIGFGMALSSKWFVIGQCVTITASFDEQSCTYYHRGRAITARRTAAAAAAGGGRRALVKTTVECHRPPYHSHFDELRCARHHRRLRSSATIVNGCAPMRTGLTKWLSYVPIVISQPALMSAARGAVAPRPRKTRW